MICRGLWKTRALVFFCMLIVYEKLMHIFFPNGTQNHTITYTNTYAKRCAVKSDAKYFAYNNNLPFDFRLLTHVKWSTFLHLQTSWKNCRA